MSALQFSETARDTLAQQARDGSAAAFQALLAATVDGDALSRSNALYGVEWLIHVGALNQEWVDSAYARLATVEDEDDCAGNRLHAGELARRLSRKISG